ncbi:hypothetical protein MY4824_009075 [Beauveria thailandica]
MPPPPNFKANKSTAPASRAGIRSLETQNHFSNTVSSGVW